jgi:hypothetical protein
MFLTNVFLLPWMAARSATPPPADDGDNAATSAGGAEGDGADARLPAPLARLAASPALGLIGGAVGALSVAWFAAAPVPGAIGAVDLAARWAHLVDAVRSDRLTLAFLVDCVVYSGAQAWLIGDEHDAIEAAARAAGEGAPRLPPAWLRFMPFAGLAAWLVARPQQAARGQ